MEYKTEECCPFCKAELQIHDYFNGKIYGYDEGKLCCPECCFIKYIGDYYVLTPFGYVKKPSKAVFKPQDHFEKKLNQILGKEIPKNENVLTEIWQYVIQKKINEISIYDLRLILKELGYSKYYDYTSYFFCKITGDELPSIPEEILVKVNCMFQKIIKTREIIQLEDSSFGKNNPHYLYLIYKIFDVILPSDDKENRRILQFIKLPSAQTLAKRDKEWDIIWKELHN